jgi:predicted alpha/beta superfamily hydrolase
VLSGFLQREVMPLIEERYSVLKGRRIQGLGGSSLGRLITLYTQLAAPGVFGRLLIESPSLFVAKGKILESAVDSAVGRSACILGWGRGKRGSGERRNDRRGGPRTGRDSARGGLGRICNGFKVRIDEGATHNESAWAARFPEALEFLYPDAERDAPD